MKRAIYHYHRISRRVALSLTLSLQTLLINFIAFRYRYNYCYLPDTTPMDVVDATMELLRWGINSFNISALHCRPKPNDRALFHHVRAYMQ
jgi:hypothetical protein